MVRNKGKWIQARTAHFNMPHKWPHADVYRNPPSYTDLSLVNFWKHVYEGVKGEAKQVRPGIMVFFPAR